MTLTRHLKNLTFVILSTGLMIIPSALPAAVTGDEPVNVGFDGQYFEAGTTNNVVMRIPITTTSGDDTLLQLTVDNSSINGTPASEPTDIAVNSVHLWYAPVDSGSFYTSTTQSVGIMTPTDPRGIQWAITGLSQTVTNNSALYVTLDIVSTPSSDVHCQFQVANGNLLFLNGNPVFSDISDPLSPPSILVTPYFPTIRLDAGHTNGGQTILSTGQSFRPTTFLFTNPDPDWPGNPLTPPAPALLTGITLTVRDQSGQIISPSTALDQIALQDLDYDFNLANTMYLPILPISVVTSLPNTPGSVFIPLAMPMATRSQHRLEVSGIVCSNTANAAANFYLECTGAGQVGVYDALSRNPVTTLPAGGDAFPMQTNLFTLQQAAKQLLVYPNVPANDVVLKGQTNVNPLNLTFTNPGNTTAAARIDVTQITLSVLTDPYGTTLAPSSVFSRVAIGGGILYGQTQTMPTTGNLITIPFTSSFCSVPVYQPITVSVQVDILPNASATKFCLGLSSATLVSARDSNSLILVAVSNTNSAYMYSNTIRIAGSLNVTAVSKAPRTLYPGQRLPMLDLTFTHPGPSDQGALVLHGVTLTARDHSGAAINMGPDISSLLLVDNNGGIISQVTPSLSGSGIYLTLPDIPLAPFSSLTLHLQAQIQNTPKDTGLSLGILDRNAVSVTQPSDPTRPVFVLGAWPLATSVSPLVGGEGGLHLSNFPNPFSAGRRQTQIAYFLSGPATVSAVLYTLAGDQVRSLCTGELQIVGAHTLSWNGRTETGGTVVNGVYLLKLDAVFIDTGETQTQLRKIAVVK